MQRCGDFTPVVFKRLREELLECARQTLGHSNDWLPPQEAVWIVDQDTNTIECLYPKREGHTAIIHALWMHIHPRRWTVMTQQGIGWSPSFKDTITHIEIGGFADYVRMILRDGQFFDLEILLREEGRANAEAEDQRSSLVG